MIKNNIKLAEKLIKRFVYGNKNLFLSGLGQNLKPKWIWYEVTDNCNSHCSHCNIWKKEPTKNQLTLEEIKKIFNDPLLCDVECVINSGGEAILRNDIVDLIKLEHEIFPNASLDLSTNGILADRALKVVQAIMDENIKINVGVSLDGIGENHDRVRGVPGNFEKADFLLKELVKLREKYPEKLSVVIGFTLSDLTIADWENVKKYADDLGVEFMMQWYNQSSFYENSTQSKNKNKETMIEVVSQQPNTIIREKWLKLINDQSIKFRCFAGQTFFAMKCDGSIVPCLSSWDDVLGNAKEQSPSVIWASPQAEQARKMVENCKGCLNSWGVEWSMTSSFYPRLLFYIRHPKAIIDRLKRRS
jgi:MoaA/NifB/PqqE/SkfB family radical SAM enzyme